MRAHPAAANIYVVERVAVLIPLDLLWGFSDMRREVRARRGNARRHRGFRVKPLSADMVGEEHLKMVREDLVRAIEDYSEIAVDLVWRVGNRLV